MNDNTIIKCLAIGCITFIAAIYDGELALIAVGAMAGILAGQTVDTMVKKGE